MLEPAEYVILCGGLVTTPDHQQAEQSMLRQVCASVSLFNTIERLPSQTVPSARAFEGLSIFLIA
jgi:hypothetical protein